MRKEEKFNSGQFKKGGMPWNKGMKGKMHPAWNKGMRGIRGNPSKGIKRPNTSGENNPLYGKFGRNHPRWKENKKHPFHKSIRETYKYRQWRSDIFTRDNFTCVLCGVRGVELNADHYPKRFIEIVDEYTIKTLEESINCEELWNINNGRTLCIPCHRKTDTWGRRKN